MNLSKLLAGMRILLSREKSYYSNKPLSATLNLTYRCNLRCQMCEIWRQYDRPAMPELTFPEIVKVIDDLYDMKVAIINLIGGEVLLRKDIIDIIKAIKKRDIFCDLTTNGTLITEDLADSLVTQKVDHIVISIDGPDESHDQIRRVSGALEKIKKSISLINSSKKIHNSRIPRITINTTVLALNLDLLDKMVPFSEELQANSLCFTHLFETKKEIIEQTNEIMGKNVTAGDIFAPEEISLLIKTNEQMQLLNDKISRIKSMSKATAVSARMGLGFYLNEDLRKNGLFPIKKCYMIHNRIMIDPYGQVFACNSLKNYIYGNVKEKRLKDIWKDEMAQSLRKKLGRNLLPICRYCGCHFDRNITPVRFLRWFVNETK